MILRCAALLAAALAFATAAQANVPVPAPPAAFYKSVTPEQMMELLKSQGATEVRLIGTAEGKNFVFAETPVGPIEVGFMDCHEQPNPCGYLLIKRYRNLKLTPAQMAMFNEKAGFAYAFRQTGSRDIVIAYPVAVRTGLTREYILSTFGLMTGVTEVFEDFATRTLHYKPEQLYSHAE